MPSVRAHPGRISCDAGFRYLHSGEPNPNVLVGAVLGGPDARDAFADNRDNAPLVGVLAFFVETTKHTQRCVADVAARECDASSPATCVKCLAVPLTRLNLLGRVFYATVAALVLPQQEKNEKGVHYIKTK
ncbi:hypothetical protein ABZP36_014130 [Zizania latifolia]